MVKGLSGVQFVRSVIIQVITRVRLQTELVDTKSYYQLIIKITILSLRLEEQPSYERKAKFALKD